MSRPKPLEDLALQFQDDLNIVSKFVKHKLVMTQVNDETETVITISVAEAGEFHIEIDLVHEGDGAHECFERAQDICESTLA